MLKVGAGCGVEKPRSTLATAEIKHNATLLVRFVTAFQAGEVCK